MANKAKVKVFDIGQAKAVYVPSKLRGDSLYPFSESEEQELVMEIKGNTVLIRAKRENEIIE
ncbi:MAG: hypothetical protein KC589_07830 [Nanoarchaeota archaeon]|nr:hypothetical protein [Nanoarchaeota archaeon]